MNEEFPLVLIFPALIGIAGLIKLKTARLRPMLKIPLFGVLLFYSFDAGVAPTATALLNLETTDAIILIGGSADANEYRSAVLALTLHYAFLALGLAFGWALMRRRPYDDPTDAITYANSSFWTGSFVVFLVGFIANVAVLFMLLKTQSLASLASTRGLFTNEDVVFNPIFNYLRLLTPQMETGAFGMILFANLKRRRTLGWFGIIAGFALHLLYGGRARALMSILSLLVLLHLGIRRLNPRQLIAGALAMVLGLCIIAIIRFGMLDVRDPASFMLGSLLFQRRLEQTAFAMRLVPARIDFFAGSTLRPSLAFLIPGLQLEGENIHRSIAEEMLGSDFFDVGVGGGNYAAAAEHFMNYGWPGIIFIALGCGAFFGSLFSWAESRRSCGLFVLLFVCCFQCFLFGAESRSVALLAATFPRVIIPLGMLSLVALSRTSSSRLLLLLMVLALGAFLLSRFGLPLMKQAMIFAIALVYLQAFRLMNFASTIRASTPVRNFHTGPD